MNLRGTHYSPYKTDLLSRLLLFKNEFKFSTCAGVYLYCTQPGVQTIYYFCIKLLLNAFAAKHLHTSCSRTVTHCINRRSQITPNHHAFYFLFIALHLYVFYDMSQRPSCYCRGFPKTLLGSRATFLLQQKCNKALTTLIYSFYVWF